MQTKIKFSLQYIVELVLITNFFCRFVTVPTFADQLIYHSHTHLCYSLFPCNWKVVALWTLELEIFNWIHINRVCTLIKCLNNEQMFIERTYIKSAVFGNGTGAFWVVDFSIPIYIRLDIILYIGLLIQKYEIYLKLCTALDVWKKFVHFTPCNSTRPYICLSFFPALILSETSVRALIHINDFQVNSFNSKNCADQTCEYFLVFQK